MNFPFLIKRNVKEIKIDALHALYWLFNANVWYFVEPEKKKLDENYTIF